MDKNLIKITKQELAELPLIKFQGEIHCVDNYEKMEEAYKKLKKIKVLGFDTETRPHFKKGISNPYKVSLIQLATNNEAFLIRIIDKSYIDKIFDILEDENIQKIGISVKDDFLALRKIKSGFSPKNFIDLQNIVKKYGIEDNSLRKICGITLKHRLSKTQQLSNWESQTLNQGQKIYAATDAWVCLKIYNELTTNFKQTNK
jgi:ribonuclease D